MSTLFSHFFQKINQISPLEANFTEVLDAIALKPKTLYFYGKMPQNVSKSTKTSAPISNRIGGRPYTVAIVGSRHNTKYGEEVAYRAAYELAQQGFVIVSGLAFGIDSIAHRGALDAGGLTVAVLGTRINHIYPKRHLSLAADIIKSGGAIISEYPPDTPSYRDAPMAPGEYGWEKASSDGADITSLSGLLPDRPSTDSRPRQLNQKLSFLYRNRIISGLADAVIIVEAAERSGSLNTATHALEQGKDVFAVPGNINSPYSQGCNKLIKQGAHPFTASSDVLQVVAPELLAQSQSKRPICGDNDVETLILQAISQGMRSDEEVMQATNLPPEVFSQSIMMLEIKGRVMPLGMGCWSIIR